MPTDVTGLTGDEYKQIAILHAANIQEGFLASLGTEFLALLYRAIDESSKGVLIVHKVNDRIVGFVSGSEGMRPIYGQLLKHPLTLFCVLLPVLFSITKLRKIIELLFLKRDQKGSDTLPSEAELLSIVVAPDYRGKGIAQLLYRKLCVHFFERGISSFIIIVGEQLGDAHRFYQKNGARSAGRLQVHAGADSILYIQKAEAGKATD